MTELSENVVEAVAMAIRKASGLYGRPPPSAMNKARAAIAAYEKAKGEG